MKGLTTSYSRKLVKRDKGRVTLTNGTRILDLSLSSDGENVDVVKNGKKVDEVARKGEVKQIEKDLEDTIIAKSKYYEKSVDYVAPVDDVDNGTATGGSINTLEDIAKAWEVNSLTGLVVEINDNGLKTFGLVISNTADTITFDADLEFECGNGYGYYILNTLEISNEDGRTIVALDIMENNCAVVLPPVDEKYERLVHTVYIERANNGNYAPVVCRGGDKVRGAKYAELIRASELLTFTLHTFLIDHWDILVQENIRRFVSGYFSDTEIIPSDTYSPIGEVINVEVDRTCRFTPIAEDGIRWYQYNSLFQETFVANIKANITKSGGISEVSIAIRKVSDGVTTDYIERESTARFSSGGDIDVVSYSTPIELKYGDRVAIIAKRTANTANVAVGTGFYLKEA